LVVAVTDDRGFVNQMNNSRKADLETGRLFYEEKIFGLGFGDGNRGRGAHLHAALAAQTLVFIHDHGLVVLHFKNPGGANIDAFLVAGALIYIYFYPPSH
jgi:hypothetical protein